MVSPLESTAHRLRRLLGRVQVVTESLRGLQSLGNVFDAALRVPPCEHDDDLDALDMGLDRSIAVWYSSLCVHQRAAWFQAAADGADALSRLIHLLETIQEKHPEIAEVLERSANLSSEYVQNTEAEARALAITNAVLRFGNQGGKNARDQFYHLVAPLGTNGHLILLGVTAQGERIQQQYNGPLRSA